MEILKKEQLYILQNFENNSINNAWQPMLCYRAVQREMEPGDGAVRRRGCLDMGYGAVGRWGPWHMSLLANRAVGR